MISLTSENGVTSTHTTGTRADIIADANCVFVSMSEIVSNYLHISPARALILMTQQALEYYANGGENE